MEQLDTPFVQLDKYSGPLDLLLRLIQKREMDIFHIDISQITNQYLDYLSGAEAPDIEHAGEFIKIAVLLMYIKSKTLLPEEPEEEEEPDAKELEKKLTRLLVKYRIFQKAGEILYERNLLGRDLWPSGFKETPPMEQTNEIEVKKEDAPLLFMQNCRKILAGERKRQPLSPPPPLPSLTDRIRDLMETLIPKKELTFSHLTCIRKRTHAKLLTFLSLLELSRMEFVSLFQETPFSDILVRVEKTINTLSLADIEQSINKEETVK